MSVLAFRRRKKVNSPAPGFSSGPERSSATGASRAPREPCLYLPVRSLRVVAGCCPNLLAEAELYLYRPEPGEAATETPADAHNHALATVRYLVSRLDERHLAKQRRAPAAETPPAAPEATAPPAPAHKKDPWLRLDNEALWRRLF